MKTLSAIGIAALFIVALMLGSTESSSQDDCEPGRQHVIQVEEDEDGNPVLRYRGGSGDEVTVCKGDNVKWVQTGRNRQFSVDFNYEKGAPFGGPKRRDSENDEIDVDIDSSAESGDYEYDVAFANGEPMDPKIIVE